MKKASILLCSALLIGLLAGCGSDKDGNNAAPANTPAENSANNSANSSTNKPAEEGKYQDGVYYAQGEPDAKTGWQYYVTLTVSGGKITEAKWNGINATVGVDKVTYSKEGKYGMKAGGASSEWHEQAEKTEQYLIEKQDPKDITLNEEGKTDAISGVSVHVNEFFDLADKALTAGPVEAGTYKDGTYHAEGDKFDEHSGWKETADVVIAAGKIVKVNFSGVNEAGEDKKQNSIDGKYGMKANGGSLAEWHEEAATAETYLVEKQDPASLTFNEEGKTDAISGVTISLKSYFDLVTKALEQAK
ncbi:major membrane immunogen (membrane-anchored lipoprotein) [Fontibacillus phaseoli]|uniref:Major membrane immunogen (Membrane-anchored lipoprotein) n=1 Tax=Fontibacillus phaseoli TaxID=1416533 RepID=A0A369AWS8_9BACL|nr:FMN-binding protein [Fontibacillus phaseoli]RCX13583.1 major membrane immunogen (membrane-anchored lipoprotein) [Fontibacillus phaseoli]